MPRPAKPGDKINQHITTAWFNETLKNRQQPRDPQLIPPENPVRVPCIAASGIDLIRFQAAGIVGPATEWDEFSSVNSLGCKVNATPTTSSWGVVQGPCNEVASSHLVVMGLTWALFDYTSGHTHVTIESDALVSAAGSGLGKIIKAPESGSDPGLILILPPGEGGNTIYRAVLKEAWAGNKAECDIYSMDGATLTDTTIDADVFDPDGVFSVLEIGDPLYVTLQNGKYYAVNNAPCP